MFGYDIADIIINIPITLLALTFHECAHGWVSTKLGDPTPKAQGRLSLNPMVHLDPVGTILMILTGFGWARPVQVDPRYYKNTKRGMALVAVAGPLANFVLALTGTIIFGALYIFTPLMEYRVLYTFLITFITRNIGLMVFNLIPIPPLDGSKVVGMFLPDRMYYKYLQYERYCMILIIILSLTGALDGILRFGITGVLRLLMMPVMLLNNAVSAFI